MHYKTAITAEKWQMRYAVIEQVVEIATHFNVLFLILLTVECGNIHKTHGPNFLYLSKRQSQCNSHIGSLKIKGFFFGKSINNIRI